MASFVRAIDEALGAAVCATVRPFTSSPLSALAVPGFQDWYRRNCNNEPPPPPPPQFSGGQCPNVRYFVSVDVVESFAGEPDRLSTPFFEVFGQISNFRLNRSCASVNPNTLQFEAGTDRFGNRTIFSSTVGIGLCNSTGNPSLNQTGLTIGNISVVRADGQPDTCGNPPPPPPSPFPVVIDPFDIEYTDDSGSPVSITLSPTIYAPVSVNTNFYVPVRLTYVNPTLNIPVNVTVNVSFERDRNGDPIPRSEPTTNPDPRPRENPDSGREPQPEDYSTPEYIPDDPGVPNPDDEDPPEDECPETEERNTAQSPTIRAVIAIVRDAGSRASKIIDPNGVALPILAPAAGWVQFRVKANESQSAYLMDIPIKNGRQFIPVPWEGGAIDYRLIPNGTGCDIQLIPVLGANEVRSRRDGAEPRCE